ncbi:hypothetical protein GCM10009425_19490 [Pseudomonas asuensis]|uniref:TIGR02444 family protein n=1 Tax=Pseudomonas asuensis TaxID=1825787 RepID=A0ABQ2GRK0_9PSED|nr:TIGR02444 family protein [Pseudomonas asuensis]GGM08374.1 hypothetical protein GCM10009425_19490 [Pseudomonas asuensis]
MENTLWPYALALYARPGVTQACLTLQGAGADVCLLLTGAWLGSRGITLTIERRRLLEIVAAPWRATVVEPLRVLRTYWKPAAQTDTALAALRERLKQLELDAEHELLTRLEQASVGWSLTAQPDPAGWLAALAGPAGTAEPGALDTLTQAALHV